MTIPNIISLLRILLVPLLLFFIQKHQFKQAFVLFLIAAFTDGLDGFIAKFFNQTSKLGTYLDPIADKLLLNTAYISLAFLHVVPVWLTAIIFSRDLIIVAGLSIIILQKKPPTIKPLLSSKITTFLQMATLCIFLYQAREPNSLLLLKATMVGVTACYTIYSCYRYLILGYKLTFTNAIDG